MKKAILAVTNDIVSDNRVHKVAMSLKRIGIEPTIVGRDLNKRGDLSKRPYRTHQMKLFFKSGAAFYAEFNIRLFFYLLAHRSDIITSNDLDTLLACKLAARIKRKRLVYDSHEYFTQVPELVNRPNVQSIWERLEQNLVPGLKYASTVCQSIADIYSSKYQVNFKIIRNVPFAHNLQEQKRIELNIPKDIPVVIYQGAVNIGRGLEHAIKAMKYTTAAHLLIVGDGDLLESLIQLSRDEGVEKRITFLGRKTIEELQTITPQATIGLSIEEDIGLNYRYALPNKLFDYTRHQVPVLASALPEIKRMVEAYSIGKVTESHEPQHLATCIESMLEDKTSMTTWQMNCLKAKEDLCWEKEEKILYTLYQDE